MKKILLFALLWGAMWAANAQSGGITVTPYGATPDQDITITIDPAVVCGDPAPGLVGATVIRLHAGVNVNGTRWQNVISADGTNDGVVGFTKNANGTWSKTLNPATYFGVTASSIQEICFVMNGGPAANVWKQKGAYQDPTSGTCGDGFIPFPIQGPWAPCPTLTAPTIIVQGATTFCPGQSVTLKAPSATGYLWSTGATSQTIVAKTSGFYSVKTFTGSCPSPISTAINVTVKQAGTYVATFAGSGASGFASGQGALASFNMPTDIVADNRNNVYVADALNHRIRKITSTGLVASFAGSGTASYQDGQGLGAGFNEPHGLAVDTNGTLYVADTKNNRIRKLIATSYASTIAGGGIGSSFDGQGVNAYFNNPVGIAVDYSGTLYVTEAAAVRKVTKDGTVTTLAGSNSAGGLGYANGQGGAARFRNLKGIAVDVAGNVFVADFGNHRIRQISAAGAVTTFAGSGTPGSDDGVGAAASFRYPEDVSIDVSGTLVVADDSGRRIRRIATDGTVTTLAGSGVFGYADGAGALAKLNHASSVALDTKGNMFLAELNEPRIRKVPSFDTFKPPISPSGGLGFCDGSTLTLSATPGFKYRWSNGDTTQNSIIGTPGSYTVQAVALGCSSAVSDPAIVYNRPAPPQPTIADSGSTNICNGKSVTLIGPAGFRYIWSNGDTTRTITVKDTGHYTLQTILAVCSSAVSAPVVVTLGNAPTQPTVTASGNLLFCAGDSVILTSSAGPRYLWSRGDTTQAIKVVASGSYTVKIVQDGCSSAPSAAAAVTVNPAPTKPTISRPTGNTLQSSYATGNQWQANGVDIAGETNQTYTATANGKYNVRYTDANTCKAVSDTFDLTLVGTLANLETIFRITPNPSTGSFKIEARKAGSNLSQADRVRVYNSLGALVYVGAASAGSITLPQVAPGLYRVQLEQAGGVSTASLIIQ